MERGTDAFFIRNNNSYIVLIVAFLVLYGLFKGAQYMNYKLKCKKESPMQENDSKIN